MKNKPVGAVLVVGGGIGGIQASLDLADSGYRVYLVEKAPAIGGAMAQLDKTFPTNDCSMCILSPKLVECGRNLNIKLLTYSDVLDIKGEQGNFKVRVRKRARFVDGTKCTGCGLCSEGCPIIMKNEFDQGLGTRKAIYVPYPQAVPNTYVIDKREKRPCKAACKDACPIHMNVPGYIALIIEGRLEQAYELLRRTNPLPAVCGRVCYAPCEKACNRGQLDDPLAIRELKRFITDHINVEGYKMPQITTNGKRVAIIGSGPAGLAAAHDLAIAGYEVSIFEALHEAGGMLRYGIPAYRLPKDVLKKDIEFIEKLGVKIITDCKIGKNAKIAELRKNYDSVFIAAGAQQSTKLGIPGEDANGVIPGVEFLRIINEGRRIDIGKKVVVVGGGNTAIDASRVVRRLNAEVEIVYRRSREEMPALPEEVKEAEDEGVKIEFLATPTKIISQNGRVSKIECIRMKLGEPDVTGRRRPIPIEGSEFVIDANTVITALGQVPDVGFLKDEGIELTQTGTIAADKDTLATNVEGIFAGGDVVTGPAIVIQAIASGKKAAISIDEYLNGRPLTPKTDEKTGEKLSDEEVKALSIRFPHQEMVKVTEKIVEERISNFSEVEIGYADEEAEEEANRCLASQIEGCIECHECETLCKANAIDYNMRDEIEEIDVGSVILSTGFDEFDPSAIFNYGYSRYKNVVTSIEFERMLSASGPFQGVLVRPSDKKPPKRIAWIQCVGSRDKSIHREYCSSVCCTYAVKEAIVAKEHVSTPLDETIFFMDLRTQGKDFDKFYDRAKREGIKFVRSKVYKIEENDNTGNLLVKFLTEDNRVDAAEFDLVVLSVGFEEPHETIELAKKIGIQLDPYSFCSTDPLAPIETSVPGIFVCGAFQGPKDIPETVTQASAAVGESSVLLAQSRNTLTESKTYSPERDVSDEEPRIGVFVCNCGINIGRYVDVPVVTEYAKTLPNVVYAENNLFTCSQDTQERIKASIREHDLNRVVVASCSPSTHEPIFQETIKEAGLNPHLFEMANIRNQCSWVHMDEPEEATEKAKDLVRIAVTKARLLEPLKSQSLPVSPVALVIGGGISGMVSALTIADQGFGVELIEKEAELGGNARNIRYTIEGEDVQVYLRELKKKVEEHPNIRIHYNSTILSTSGYIGNFITEINENNRTERIEHGVVVIATGAEEHKPYGSYLYRKDDRVLTQLELEGKIAAEDPTVIGCSNLAMILCAGSRDEGHPYCSKVCCNQAIKNALKLKEINPEMNIYIFHRDIRTYGLYERYYQKAREKGVIFLRYEQGNEPNIELENKGKKSALKIKSRDPVLDDDVVVEADLVTLSVPMDSRDESEDLAELYKVPRNEDGFFLEAHVKLRPVEFATNGIFLCGLAHSPKPIGESIVQAKAAASKACIILSKPYVESEATVATVYESLCSGCGACIEVCPAKAIALENGKAKVNEVLCKGCGLCSATCRAGAIQQKKFEDREILAMIDAALGEEV